MSAQELTPPKRFITENNAEGKAVFSTQIPEQLPARVIECGDKFFLGYTTNERPVDINGNKDVDTYSEYLTNEPGIVIPGGTVLRFVDIRPGGVSPMHRTVSLDYGVVVEGQVIIRLDSGESRLMQRGDVTIQRGTMHEWENASKTEWARMMYVLQDSKPLIAGGKPLGEEYGVGMGEVRPSGN
ncbi:cupin domain-containing protein [Ilyonectria robusta]|uniref:cupin domain-containing protein n=1 Tax=Ilyonectria robusta TaxID=1079257 RepID=UPI001E8D37E4|nr:cupin domain-containing protein [Ilyonectria robusta]KAH8737650.1 cupin domain-containing protein [Ilyonectria robusta]